MTKAFEYQSIDSGCPINPVCYRGSSDVSRKVQNRVAPCSAFCLDVDGELSRAISHLWSNSASTKSRLRRVSDRLGARIRVFKM